MADENRMITFEYAASTWDQYKKQTVPSTKECMTKQELIDYFNVDTSQLSSLGSNQLVRRDKFSPSFLDGIFGDSINQIVEYDDDYILVAGKFDTVNGQPIRNLVKIKKPKGINQIIIDNTFTVNIYSTQREISKLMVLSDKTILVGMPNTGMSNTGNLIAHLDNNGNLIKLLDTPTNVFDFVEVQNFLLLKSRKYNILNFLEITSFNTNYENTIGANSIQNVRSIDMNTSNTIIYYGGLNLQNINGSKSLVFLDYLGNYVPHNIDPMYFTDTNSKVWSVKNTSYKESQTNNRKFEDLTICWSDSSGSYISIINMNGYGSKKIKISNNSNLINIITDFNIYTGLTFNLSADVITGDYTDLEQPLKRMTYNRNTSGNIVNINIVNQYVSNDYSSPNKYAGLTTNYLGWYIKGAKQGTDSVKHNLFLATPAS